MTRKPPQSFPELLPFHGFYAAQLDKIPLRGGHFLWAPRGFCVHRAVESWASTAKPTDARIKVVTFRPHERKTPPDVSEQAYYVLLQIEADFEQIHQREAPEAFWTAMERRFALVTSNLPPYLVDDVHMRRLLGKDGPADAWEALWSNWWDQYGWQKTELRPWARANRLRTREWCAATECTLRGTDEADGRRLWPARLGVQPAILHAAWSSVLAEERSDWSADELEAAVVQAALTSEAMRAMTKAFKVLRESPDSAGALDMLRRLARARDTSAVMEMSAEDPELVEQLHQLGLTYPDDTNHLQLTCPLFGEHVIRRWSAPPTNAPAPAKVSTAAPAQLSAWSFEEARYVGDAHAGVLQLLEGGRASVEVPISGGQHVQFVRMLAEATAPIPVSELQEALGVEREKNVINHVDRLRKSIDEQLPGLRAMVIRKRGAIELTLAAP